MKEHAINWDAVPDVITNPLFLRLVKEYAEREGVTEQLKAENPTEWVQKMNNIRNRAAETVCADLIFT